MNQLNTLLRDASADAPADHLDVAAVVRAGRARVRRRHATTAVAVAAMAGLALGLPLVAPDGGRGGGSPATAPVKVTLDDAVPADPGSDYRVLAEFTAHSTDREMTGDFVRGVLPDGTVVVQRYPNGAPGRSEIALVASETRTVEAPAAMVNFLGATERRLVFGATNRGLWVLDIAALEWRHVLANSDVSPNLTVQPLTGTNEHVYIAAHANDDQKERAIYDVDLDAGTATEVARGGDVAAYAGRVAWTDALHAPVTEVTVRDERGNTRAFDPQTGACLGTGLGITAQRIVLMTNCGDTEDPNVVTRIDVFTLAGDPIATISGDDEMGPVRVADRYLTLTTWGGDRGGTYTYDLESGRFLRVTESMSELAGDETGVGSTVVWEVRLDGETGARYVVAEMQ